MTKAERLLDKVATALRDKGSYSHGGRTWKRDGNKLSEHKDATGNWHSVSKASLTHHVCFVARTCADWSDDAEGEVIDAMRAKYGETVYP